MTERGTEVMMSCPDFGTRDPSHPNHASRRCKPLRISDGIAAIPWVNEGLQRDLIESCLKALIGVLHVFVNSRLCDGTREEVKYIMTLKNFTKDNYTEDLSLITLKFVSYCYPGILIPYNPTENSQRCSYPLFSQLSALLWFFSVIFSAIFSQ